MKPWERAEQLKREKENIKPWERAKAIKEGKEPDGLSSGVDPLEMLSDFGMGAAQGATYEFGDEMYGGVQAAQAMLDNDAANFSEEYQKGRDAARERYDLAKDRNPIPTALGGIGGAVLSPINKVIGAGRGLRGVVRGVTEGGAASLGATEELDEQGALETGVGAALGGATGVLANVASEGFKKTPSEVRATVLGAGRKEMSAPGAASRRNTSDLLAKKGLFKGRAADFDDATLSWKPAKSARFTLDELDSPTEVRIRERLQTGIDRAQVQKEQFKQVMDEKLVSMQEVMGVMDEVTEEFSKRGVIKGPGQRREAVAKLSDNLKQIIAEELPPDLGNGVPLSAIDTIKRRLQQDVANYDRALGDATDNDELLRITARKFKDLLNKKMPDRRFQEINEFQHRSLTALGDLDNKIAALASQDVQRPMQLEKTNFVEDLLKRAGGGSQGDLDRAFFKEGVQKYVPEAIRKFTPFALEETPGTIYRQQFQGRRPQSVSPAIRSIPEELIKTPLPRNTESLMKNKNLVLGKIAQMAPEMLEDVAYMMNEDPQAFEAAMPALSEKMPHFFERDKYNKFNGVIHEPKMMKLAIADINKDREMPNSAKADMIQKILRKEQV